jgi:hypothetical protein
MILFQFYRTPGSAIQAQRFSINGHMGWKDYDSEKETGYVLDTANSK